jgi:anti-sigma factor RsiW
MTAKGFKHKVPQQVAGYLDALAQGAVDKAPPIVQAALDAYVDARIEAQMRKVIADLSGASQRLDASFARAGAMADAVKAGKPLADITKAGRPQPPRPPRPGRK